MSERAQSSTSPSNAAWFKSSYSGGEGNECAEARRTAQGLDVRDSKTPDGPHIAIDADAWRAFILAVRARRFD